MEILQLLPHSQVHTFWKRAPTAATSEPAQSYERRHREVTTLSCSPARNSQNIRFAPEGLPSYFSTLQLRKSKSPHSDKLVAASVASALQTPSKATTSKTTSLRPAVKLFNGPRLRVDTVFAPLRLHAAWKDWSKAEQRLSLASLQSAARLAHMLDTRLLLLQQRVISTVFGGIVVSLALLYLAWS